MMKVVRFASPGRAELVEHAIVEPGQGELLIETEISLVSTGTERTLLMHAPKYPIIPGYSVVGKVVGMGTGAKRFAIGDRVIASAAHASHVVCDERFALAVPDGVSSAHAAFFNIGAMAIHAVRLAEIGIGDPLLILGQGLIGLVTTQIARMNGALPVIGVDTDPARVELSRRLGADHSFSAADQVGLRAYLQSLPGGGPAAVIELTGNPGPVETAIEVARRGARIVPASVVPGGFAVDLYGLVMLKSLKLAGSNFVGRPWCIEQTEATSPLDWPIRLVDGGYYEGGGAATSLADIALFLRYAEQGRLNLDPLLDQFVHFEEAPQMFEALPAKAGLGTIIRWN